MSLFLLLGETEFHQIRKLLVHAKDQGLEIETETEPLVADEPCGQVGALPNDDLPQCSQTNVTVDGTHLVE
jgi:hypothetical protein